MGISCPARSLRATSLHIQREMRGVHRRSRLHQREGEGGERGLVRSSKAPPKEQGPKPHPPKGTCLVELPLGVAEARRKESLQAETQSPAGGRIYPPLPSPFPPGMRRRLFATVSAHQVGRRVLGGVGVQKARAQHRPAEETQPFAVLRVPGVCGGHSPGR